MKWFCLILLVIGIGCGKTYEKPTPVLIIGYYEYDGATIKLTPSGSNSITELSRYNNKNISATIQER